GGEHVLFLVNGSETMLDDLVPPSAAVGTEVPDFRERGRTFLIERRPGNDAEKRAAIKWQRAAQVLDQMLRELPVETPFHVALFFDDQVVSVGGRVNPEDHEEVA